MRQVLSLLPCAQRLSHHLLQVTEDLLTEAPAGSQQGNLLLYQLAYVRLLGAMHSTYVADKDSIKAKLKVGPCLQLLSMQGLHSGMLLLVLMQVCPPAAFWRRRWPGLWHRPAACSFNLGTAHELNPPNSAHRLPAWSLRSCAAHWLPSLSLCTSLSVQLQPDA